MKKIKVIYNSILIKVFNKVTRQNLGAITIYPFILTDYEKGAMPKWMINHELFHISQIMRIGWFSYYTSYLLYYFAGLMRFKNHNEAHYHVPYEAEAYRDHYEGSEYELN